MIATWMVYTIVVGLLLTAAAGLSERAFRRSRVPARAAWVVAIVLTTLFAALAWPLSSPPPAEGVAQARPIPAALPPAEAIAVDEGAGMHAPAPRPATGTNTTRARAFESLSGVLDIRVDPRSTLLRMDAILLLAWGIASLVMLAILFGSAARLALARRSWRNEVIADVPVLVSHDLGPAVFGLARYRIVLPSWVLELDHDEQKLIVAHERSHAQAGDPALLFGATLLFALMPWNLALLAMIPRLRAAIELDCDSRVLAASGDVGTYGSLLLDVSERSIGGALPVAALAESAGTRLVERRIRAMTDRLPRYLWARRSAAGAAALAMILVACVTPRPVVTGVGSGESSAPATVSLSDRATIDSLRRVIAELEAREADAAAAAAAARAEVRAANRRAEQTQSGAGGRAAAAARGGRGEGATREGAAARDAELRARSMAGRAGEGQSTTSVSTTTMTGRGGSTTTTTSGGRSAGVSPRIQAVNDSARALARRLYPEAFRRTSGVTMFGVIYDSTGAVLRHNAVILRELPEVLTDHSMRRELFPDMRSLRVDSWGLSSPDTRNDVGRVAIYWASTGIPPWGR